MWGKVSQLKQFSGNAAVVGHAIHGSRDLTILHLGFTNFSYIIKGGDMYPLALHAAKTVI